MKKILTSLVLLHFAVAGNAQLSVGSTAPDFTVTDIEGNSHKLYDYLDEGYSVVLDISATWCGPCWYFHEQHVLKDLYEKYGPTGSVEAKKIMTLYVEGDATTGLADLNGETAGTQGDWVTGMPYPIIDDASLSSLYGIGGYPSVFLICPDRKVAALTGMSLPAEIFTDEYWSGKADETCVTGTGINNPKLQGVEINAYPSPATDNINLSLKLDRQLGVNISIIDVVGKTVVEGKQYTLNAGEQVLNFNVNHLPAGVYTFMVQSADGNTQFKFVKQ